MIKHYPYNRLGKANHGWLKSSHHFSFANYYNPKRMGFGTLRVINDDWVQAGKGFPSHPHRNMEIISIIRTGAITHNDSEGNKGVTEEGKVQVMSAGTGILHSEYNLSKDPLTFYQIWIETNKHNVKPRWDTRLFPQRAIDEKLPLLVSGYPDDQGSALFINQSARIYGGKVNKGTRIEHKITHQAYVLASKGVFELEDNQKVIKLEQGDGAEISNQASILINAISDCEIVIIDAPVN